MAQWPGFDLDEATEQRIRAAYGPCDTTTVADELGLTEEEEEIDESGEGCYFHVGIKWNEKQLRSNHHAILFSHGRHELYDLRGQVDFDPPE